MYIALAEAARWFKMQFKIYMISKMQDWSSEKNWNVL